MVKNPCESWMRDVDWTGTPPRGVIGAAGRWVIRGIDNGGEFFFRGKNYHDK